MKTLINITVCLCALLLTSCSGTYTEDELDTLTEAQTVYLESLGAFGESYDQLATITSLQDSLQSKIETVNGTIKNMDTGTDSLETVKGELETALEHLTLVKNDLLEWPKSIYGMPDLTDVFPEENPKEDEGFAKDQQNEMIMNNITYKKLPENITPEELLTLQKEQYEEIGTIRHTIDEAIKDADKTIAKNL